MRRWWFVPVVVLLVALFLRARPAGYTSTTSQATQPTVAAETSITVPTTVVLVPTVAPTTTVEPLIIPTVAVSTSASAVPAVITSEPSTPTASAVVPTPTHEPPVLAPEIAPPTPRPPSPTPPPNAQASAPTSVPLRPVRLQISAIGLDLEPISVGLDAQRVPIVPKHDVGWFNTSALPGGGSNVVFWGHVLRWLDSPNVPAPFARMSELAPGAQIDVTLADGRQFTYRVTEQVQARPEEVAYILPTGGERLTLVSCIGDNVIREGVLTKEFRLITIAEPQ